MERRFAVKSGEKKRRPIFTDCISWLLQNAGVFWMGAVAFNSATQATHATSWQVQLGSIVIALGWSSCVIGSVQRSIRERNAPPLSDAAARAAHSRARLQQQLAQSRTFRRWLPALLGAAMCGGYVLAQPKWLNGWAMFFALLTIWVLRQGSPTRLQAQIARIDQNIAELEASRMRALTANSAPAEFIRTQSFENLFRRRRQFRGRVVR